jgi:hypothetical protein
VTIAEPCGHLAFVAAFHVDMLLMAALNPASVTIYEKTSKPKLPLQSDASCFQ